MNMKAENLKKSSLPYGLKNKLMNSFLLIIFVLTGFNSLTLIWTGSYYRNLSDKLNRQTASYEISMNLYSVTELLGNYVNSGNIAYLQDIKSIEEKIHFNISYLMNHDPIPEGEYYQYYDLTSMVESFFEQLDNLVLDFQKGTALIYIWDMMWPLNRLSGYIMDELVEINLFNMVQLKNFYSQFSVQMIRVIRILIVLIIFLLCFSFLLARRFTLAVSNPIHDMALQLVRFGHGELDVQIKTGQRHDEITVLGQSFNQMTQRIKNLIEDIKDKAVLEKKLKDREILHHETERLLRESELELLQSQINPHFLFNTLNIIASLSVIEKAPETGRVITSLSNLLRYNLKNQNEIVCLEDEIDMIRSYMTIQKTRFAEKIIYKEEIDKNLLGIKIPSMIIQPLVENAVKHGLEPVGRQGTLELVIHRQSSLLEIKILDDGVGIKGDVINALKNSSQETNSIGIRNVMRRLELRYGHPVLEINSRIPCGTECLIRIPIDTAESK